MRDAGCGAQMLDTPVSGSVPQVKTGTLTIMVGGDEDAYARVEPVLRVLGTPEHVGDNGQGLVLKLAINISLAVQMLAFSEGLLLAERDGIDPHLAAEVMTESAIGSPMLKARVPLVLDQPDETWFDVELMHKDIRLAREAGDELATSLPVGRRRGQDPQQGRGPRLRASTTSQPSIESSRSLPPRRPREPEQGQTGKAALAKRGSCGRWRGWCLQPPWYSASCSR